MLYGRLKGPPKNLLVPHFKELRTEAFSPSYVPQRGRLADAAEAEYRPWWEQQGKRSAGVPIRQVGLVDLRS